MAGEAVELHMHTRASDGSMSPEYAVRLAARRGLRGVAVTDHDTFRGSVLASRAARILGGPVLVVYAAEIRSSAGDILVYCGEPHERWPRDVWELLDWARDNNCAPVAAHPYHPGRHSVGGLLPRIAGRLAAVEAWNSRGLPIFNLPAIRLARRLGLPVTSGSDAHVSRELGVSPTLILGEPEKPEDIVEAILSGSTRPNPGLPGPLTLAEVLAWSIARRV